MRKPSERINRYVAGRRTKRFAEGTEAAASLNVSGHLQDPECAAYIAKLLEVIDELEARVRTLENRKPIVAMPRRLMQPASTTPAA